MSWTSTTVRPTRAERGRCWRSRHSLWGSDFEPIIWTMLLSERFLLLHTFDNSFHSYLFESSGSRSYTLCLFESGSAIAQTSKHVGHMLDSPYELPAYSAVLGIPPKEWRKDTVFQFRTPHALPGGASSDVPWMAHQFHSGAARPRRGERMWMNLKKNIGRTHCCKSQFTTL